MSLAGMPIGVGENLLSLYLDFDPEGRRLKGECRTLRQVKSSEIEITPGEKMEIFSRNSEIRRKAAEFRRSGRRVPCPEKSVFFEPDSGQPAVDPVFNPIRDIQGYQSTHQYQNLPETERESIIQSRIGQGRFRTELIKYWRGCAVTDCQTIEILRASHIKPWRKSSNEERLDVYNGLLLIPNLDVAFDNGLISFADEGKIMISDFLTEDERCRLGIHPDMRMTRIDKRYHEYLKYHREHVFNKNAR